jgi:prolipoprotein diacylglyceryltransferase
MNDFIRLNLNSFIGSASFLIGIFIAFFIIERKLQKEHKKYALYGVLITLGIFFFALTFKLLTQTSVNQLPKNEIDKSYLNQVQDSYQIKVLENSKKSDTGKDQK